MERHIHGVLEDTILNWRRRSLANRAGTAYLPVPVWHFAGPGRERTYCLPTCPAPLYISCVPGSQAGPLLPPSVPPGPLAGLCLRLYLEPAPVPMYLLLHQPSLPPPSLPPSFLANPTYRTVRTSSALFLPCSVFIGGASQTSVGHAAFYKYLQQRQQSKNAHHQIISSSERPDARQRLS